MVQSIDRKIQLLRCIRLLPAGSGVPGHPLDPLWAGKKLLAIQYLEFSHYRRGFRLHSWAPGSKHRDQRHSILGGERPDREKSLSFGDLSGFDRQGAARDLQEENSGSYEATVRFGAAGR